MRSLGLRSRTDWHVKYLKTVGFHSNQICLISFYLEQKACLTAWHYEVDLRNACTEYQRIFPSSPSFLTYAFALNPGSSKPAWSGLGPALGGWGKQHHVSKMVVRELERAGSSKWKRGRAPSSLESTCPR